MWSDPKTKISKYFTAKEALFLPTYNRMANPADGLDAKIKVNLIKSFEVMDKIRDLFGKPIIVHVAYRPSAYNTLIGGSPRSSHIAGLAVDFHVVGLSCDDVRKILKDKLVNLNIRMEDLPGSSWVHIDLKKVWPGQPRLFRP